MALAAAALLACACGDAPWQTAGGGSATETTGGAKVTGMAIYPDGAPAANARVRAHAAVFGDSVPDFTATTGKDGRYRFDSLPSGDYVFEIDDGNGNAVMADFRKDLERGDQARRTDTLHTAGRLAGLLGQADSIPDTALVQIFGLGRKGVRADAQGRFAFEGLPAGRIRLRMLTTRPHRRFADTVVALGPGQDAQVTLPPPGLDENYAAWARSLRIVVQTKAVGVLSDAYDFPLAVRLTRPAYDFAQSDGKDLRFADAKGRPLAFALEKWDPAAGEAVAWVHLDTVRGDAADTLRAYWGNPGSPDLSDPKAVFGSFSAAWRFGEAAGAAYSDASPTGASAAGSVDPADRRGAVGSGIALRGNDTVTSPAVPALMPEAALTLSAWVRIDAANPAGMGVATLGGDYGLRIDSAGHPHFFLWAGSGYLKPWDLDIIDSGGLGDGQWHLLTGTYNGTSMRIFLDGDERASMQPRNRLLYPQTGAFRMGGAGENAGGGFAGGLDEVEVSPRVRASEWIQLRWEAERPGSKLLRFLP